MNAVFFRRVLRGAIGTVVVFAVAEAVVRVGIVNEEILPPLSTILGDAVELAGDGEFRTDARATVTSWLTGLLIAIVVAVPAGLLLGSLRQVEAAVRPLMEFLRPIPSVAIVPLTIMVFREELHWQVAAVMYSATWPILINTLYGLREVDPLAKETLRSFGFGPLAIVRRVSLPSTAPFVMTGIRLSASIALMVAITAELVGEATEGIGSYINENGLAGEIGPIYAATIWAGIFGLAANILLARAERRMFRWHRASSGVEGA